MADLGGLYDVVDGYCYRVFRFILIEAELNLRYWFAFSAWLNISINIVVCGIYDYAKLQVM